MRNVTVLVAWYPQRVNKTLSENQIPFAELSSPPRTLPSGWASVLYLYVLRRVSGFNARIIDTTTHFRRIAANFAERPTGRVFQSRQPAARAGEAAIVDHHADRHCGKGEGESG